MKVGRYKSRPYTPEDVRFWRQVDKSAGEHACWMWTGAILSSGYGLFHCRSPDKNVRAHRYVWLLANGFLPPDLFVCHHCDVPACVNPSHLFLGTAADNRHDCMRKGRLRVPLGESHPFAKLTETQVRQIRQDNRKQAVIAAEYDVSRALIYRIIKGHIWKSVRSELE